MHSYKTGPIALLNAELHVSVGVTVAMQADHLYGDEMAY